MIKLYTAPTPNGHKVSCTLEALNMDYEAILVNLSDGEQKKPDFLKISPNGRIPAIVDTSNSRLLVTGSLSTSQAVTSGNTFTLAAFDIEIPDPS